jgi:Fe-S-cluster containining protein
LEEAAKTRALSIHARYGCRSSGACCTAGWAIPVEPQVEEGLRHAWETKRLRVGAARSVDDLLRPAAGLPDRARVLLRHDGRGRCAFFEPPAGNLCAIHRQLGHGALPVACRQFPRVALLAPDAVCLTLSHFCPTAADLLFADGPCGIVEDPLAFPPRAAYEGLDAREALSPLLRPGVLMGWDGYRLWEAHAIALLTDASLAPEEALARLEAQAEAARAWRVEEGPFLSFLPDALSLTPAPPPPHSFADHLHRWELVRACVPAGLQAPAALHQGAAEADRRFVAPTWPTWSGPVRRYLAAKAFASWCALQGQGLRTTVSALRAAWAVLRVEAARVGQAAGRPLDAILMKEAIRAADLLLVHLASPEDLARALSVAESPGTPATAPFGSA